MLQVDQLLDSSGVPTPIDNIVETNTGFEVSGLLNMANVTYTYAAQ